jgi:hypothetical protein
MLPRRARLPLLGNKQPLNVIQKAKVKLSHPVKSPKRVLNSFGETDTRLC